MNFRRVHLMFAILLTFTLVVLYTQTNIIGTWMYPIKYKSAIEANAETFQIDPYLVAAIIRVESNYDPNKVSSRDAIGLMQLMPSTAAYTIERMALNAVKRSELTTPSNNIYVGTAYLNVLKQTFIHQLQKLDGKSQITLLAVAYNAGPGKAAQWLSDETWNGTADSLAGIPYGETRHYAQRVLYFYEKYKGLNGLSVK
ncbi:MAG: hypothetical protein RLZZ267_1196 [Bacillota bacterium]